MRDGFSAIFYVPRIEFGRILSFSVLLHFSAGEILAVLPQAYYILVLEFQSFSIFSCILFFSHSNKSLTMTVAHAVTVNSTSG